MKTFKKTVGQIIASMVMLAVAFSVVSLVQVKVVQAGVNTGSVKTVAYCGQQGNVNPFAEGSTVKGEAKDLQDNTDYRWNVVKVDQPGKDTVVSSGTFHLNEGEHSICDDVYKPAMCLQGDNHSEYKLTLEKKVEEASWQKVDSDNFFVNCGELEALRLAADCAGINGKTTWKISNPNAADVHFSYEVRLASGSGVLESGSGTASASSDTFLTTNTTGNIRLTIYWPENGEHHACATNEGVKVCATPTPTPTPTSTPTPEVTPTPTSTVSPQILGTSTAGPGLGGGTTSLPSTGGSDDSLYLILLAATVGFSYYLKKVGWARLK